jgi:chaperonin GroEL
MKLTAFNSDWLGKARKVTVDKNSTVVVDGAGTTEDITQRANDIKALIDNAVSPYEIEILQDRLGRMAGGVGVIHVGGYTEVEMKEKKDRVEDALHATRAALEEGILPGGGIALLYASLSLFDTMDSIEFTHPDQKTGYLLTLSSIKQPIFKILYNALGEKFEVGNIITELTTGYDKDNEESFWRGYNPRIRDFVNMFESGVIDPKKVTRLALENASSVAGTFLITECVVSIPADEKEEQDNNYLAQQMMGM